MVCLHVVPKTEKKAGKFKIDKSVCCTDSPNYPLDLMTSDSNQSKGDFLSASIRCRASTYLS